MKKIKVEITRVDTYVIEVDETVFNKEWHDAFKEHFYDVTDYYNMESDPETDLEAAIHEGVAITLASYQAKNGNDGGCFIEGFGYVKRDGTLGYGREDFDEKGAWLPEDQRRKASDGLNIIIDSEDDDLSWSTEIFPNA